MICSILRQRFYGVRMGAAEVQYLEHQFKEKIAYVAVVIKCYITVTVLLQIRHLLDIFFFFFSDEK